MKKIAEQMRILGLNPKKEVLTLVLYDAILLLAGTGIYFFFGQALVFLYVAGILVLFDLLYLSRYGKAIVQTVEKKEEDFVNLFSFFSIYIANGFNVYSALRESLVYCASSIKPDLEKLIAEIDNDKTIAPFLTFSSCFTSLSIKEVLLSVYQMIDEGGGEAHLARFTYLFQAFAAEKRKIKKEKEAASLSSLSSLPLIGSGIAMLMLTAALVEIMGGLFDVI